MIRIRNKHSYSGPGEYIARPSHLGNPFSHRDSKYTVTLVSTREEAIACFEDWLTEQLQTDTPAKREFDRLVALYRAKGELTLLCYCDPQPCHGHVLRKRILEEAVLRSNPGSAGGLLP